MSSVPVKERVKVSQNWRLGRCREGILLKWRCSQMPWMQLEGNSLYISQADFILAYQFRPDGASVHRRPLAVFAGHGEDVCHFVLANSHIISAGGDGKIGIHQTRSTFAIKYLAHEQEVNCVDCKGGVVVSGSRDRTAKVWPWSSGRLGQCSHTIQTEDRVWSVAISPLLSGQLMTHLGSDFPPGAGVLDVMYESPSTLLSCGYDTYVRYWDLRTSVRTSSWPCGHTHASALSQGLGSVLHLLQLNRWQPPAGNRLFLLWCRAAVGPAPEGLPACFPTDVDPTQQSCVLPAVHHFASLCCTLLQSSRPGLQKPLTGYSCLCLGNQHLRNLFCLEYMMLLPSLPCWGHTTRHLKLRAVSPGTLGPSRRGTAESMSRQEALLQKQAHAPVRPEQGSAWEGPVLPLPLPTSFPGWPAGGEVVLAAPWPSDPKAPVMLDQPCGVPWHRVTLGSEVPSE
ncbi:F-box/WD repeat-containing protein 4 isoform X1 [Octodon degus]|uniref:F-box/WD repeat-containing protein 4 isoform X1 n=1 Tax=Octodon degus TaxID=10160 RepID=A0A6P6EH11_OCTDE|nr:F-box/WD repeat-containing protein 4 isoform X1 [Octodon degus]